MVQKCSDTTDYSANQSIISNNTSNNIRFCSSDHHTGTSTSTNQEELSRGTDLVAAVSEFLAVDLVVVNSGDSFSSSCSHSSGISSSIKQSSKTSIGSIVNNSRGLGRILLGTAAVSAAVSAVWPLSLQQGKNMVSQFRINSSN